jgi:acetyl esterase/lipase
MPVGNDGVLARRSAGWAACLVLCLASSATAQASKGKDLPNRPPRPPSFEDVRYGPHERNVLDLYLAKSDKPTPLVLWIHGGAWIVGDKKVIPPQLLDVCKEAGISVASMNHRYATQSPYPAPFLDGARAVQFLRHRAREYNLDPKAVAVTGGSSGADIALWLAFHDDLADPASDDPVLRQSTRLACAGARDAQTTLDLRVVNKLLQKEGFLNRPLLDLFGLRDDEIDTPRAFKLYEEGTAATHLTRDDPPVFLYYGFPNTPITPDTPRAERSHNPVFGTYLKERMDKAGVKCVLHFREDYADAGEEAPLRMNQDQVRFFLEHFPK